MAGGEIYINIEDGIKRVMNNTKLYVKLLGKFKEDPSINEIEKALEVGDLKAAQEHSHALKGLAGNLSLIILHENCTELEKQIKAGSVNPGQIAAVKNVYALTLLEVDKVISLYA